MIERRLAAGLSQAAMRSESVLSGSGGKGFTAVTSQRHAGMALVQFRIAEFRFLFYVRLIVRLRCCHEVESCHLTSESVPSKCA